MRLSPNASLIDLVSCLCLIIYDNFNILHEPPCTEPYARWCDRESSQGPTYVDCRACTAAWRCKPSTQPDGGQYVSCPFLLPLSIHYVRLSAVIRNLSQSQKPFIFRAYIQLFGIFEKFLWWHIGDSDARGLGSHPVL